MITGFKTALTLLYKAIASKQMLFWAIKFFTKLTDNNIDDRTYDLVVAMDSGDIQKIRTSLQELGIEIADVRRDKLKKLTQKELKALKQGK